MRSCPQGVIRDANAGARQKRVGVGKELPGAGCEVMAVCSTSVDDGERNLFRASAARRDQLRLAAEVIALPLRVRTQQESSASWRL